MAADEQVHQFKEFDKFSMFTPAPGVPNRRSRLVWSTYRGNPRITVFTGVPDDTEKGVIRAAMNPETFNIMVAKFEELAAGPNDQRICLDNYTAPKKEDGTPDFFSADRVKVSETWFGKNREGKMWISVRAENRPSIVFEYVISDFHKFRKGDGSEFTESENSIAQMRSTFKGLGKAIDEHSALLKPPYDPEQKNKGKPFVKKEANKSFTEDDIMF